MLLKTSIFSFMSWGETDWITAILLLILILLTLLFSLHRRKYTLLLRSLYSPRHFTQLSHEGKIFQERLFLLDISGILFTQALFCYFLIKIFLPHLYSDQNPFVIYSISFGIVLFYSIFKSCMTFVFTLLYDLEEERESYFSYKLFYQTSNSLILFPLLVIATYSSFYTILLFYIPLFLPNGIILIYRLFALTLKKVHPFHFFIYFCTFEILPCLLIIKMLFIIDGQAV